MPPPTMTMDTERAEKAGFRISDFGFPRTEQSNPKSDIRHLKSVPSRSERAHHLDHGFHILHRGLRQDTVSEVEDVAGARAGALQQIGDGQLELGQWREEDGGIEVALDRRAVADVHPGLVDVDPPIDAEHVAAGGMQLAEEPGGAGAEVNHRHAGRSNTL